SCSTGRRVCGETFRGVRPGAPVRALRETGHAGKRSDHGDTRTRRRRFRPTRCRSCCTTSGAATWRRCTSSKGRRGNDGGGGGGRAGGRGDRPGGGRRGGGGDRERCRCRRRSRGVAPAGCRSCRCWCRSCGATLRGTPGTGGGRGLFLRCRFGRSRR